MIERTHYHWYGKGGVTVVFQVHDIIEVYKEELTTITDYQKQKQKQYDPSCFHSVLLGILLAYLFTQIIQSKKINV